MKLTNKCGLPQPMVDAVEWSNRDRQGCDYTITELLKPARVAALERQYADQIEEDASDRLWILLGSAGHEVLRRSAKTGIVEERAIVEVEADGRTFKIGGQLDYGTAADNTLTDFKFTSVWAAKEGPRDEWVQQLNIYRWLAGRYGVAFDRLQIVAIFRDWSKPKAAREKDYPQAQVKVFDLPLWRDDSTEQFIIDRIRAHEAAKVTLPECSTEEMWEKPAVYAVMKGNNKRAVKLHDVMASALAHSRQSKDLFVERRPPERPRCESYCRCAPFCEQWKAFQNHH